MKKLVLCSLLVIVVYGAFAHQVVVTSARSKNVADYTVSMTETSPHHARYNDLYLKPDQVRRREIHNDS
jgi:hypothetical protein